jgi:alkylated DNA repair dioxygenase AlkB
MMGGANQKESGQLDLGWVIDSPHLFETAPDGLELLYDVIDRETEALLLDAIDRQNWSNSLSRRVQHYGWRYDYKSRRVLPGDYLGPLPTFLTPLTEIVEQKAGMTPDQAIINEYLPGQGIARHVDCEPCFGPVVAMVGLGSDVQMDFYNADHDTEWAAAFRRRSMLVVSGDARSRWAHGIAKRRSDPTFSIQRQRRVSVTFRTVTR